MRSLERLPARASRLTLAVMLGFTAVLPACVPMAPPGTAKRPGAFVVDRGSLCAVWDPAPPYGETVHWSGLCVDHRAQGHGTATFFLGNRQEAMVTGDFVQGHAVGGVHIRQRNGDVLVAEVRDDQLSGNASLQTERGVRFDGPFVDGKFEGQVTITFADGGSIESLWHGGKFQHEVFPSEAFVPQDVPVVDDGTALRIPVTINGTLTRAFVVDSGASITLIPADLFEQLRKSGSVGIGDALGVGSMTTATGEKSLDVLVRLRNLRIGGADLPNVLCIVGPAHSELLLGRSVLNRFNTWSFDNARHMLHLG